MSKRSRLRCVPSQGRFVLTFIIVAVLAVVSGYGFTNYIIKPLFFGADEAGKDEVAGAGEEGFSQEFEGSSIIIDQQEIQTEDENTSAPLPDVQDSEQAGTVTSNMLYSIQFGSFSDRTGAEVMSSTLALSDISTTIVEKAGSYKLIGAPFISKDEAVKALEEVKKIVGDEPFITTVEVIMR